MAIEIGLVPPERHAEFTTPLRVAFGLRFDAERAARMQRLREVSHRIGAFDGGELVGTAGAFDFTMTTPGGVVKAAGLTMVGVMPTHRRRGVLTRMMERHFEESRAAGFPISALWASEGQIYGRFGYGLASLSASISIERDRAIFRRPVPKGGELRLLDETAARASFPGVYDRVRAVTPGMMSRSELWWDFRRLGDFDKSVPPLQRVLLTIDGEPEGYALYRFTEHVTFTGICELELGVAEAVATSPAATAMLWRYLCDIDLVRRIESPLLPPTHPLLTMVTEARRLRMKVADALWVRILDADAALAARTFPARGAVTFALTDDRCPWNAGVYQIGDGRSSRTTARPELRFDAATLGSLYLGGIGAQQLADAGDIEELEAGAIERADALFRSARAPWCPEIF